MGFYDDVILPRLVHLAMRNARLLRYRERVAAAAQGRVLEIGIGSGLNLPFYSPAVSEVLGLEPSARLIAMAQRAADESAQRVRLVEGSAEAIPLDAQSVDSVVTTWTLCSIPNAGAALAEMRRVLRPGGRLLFVEHGRAPDASVCAWQNRLTPLWRRLAGGCHLNRPIRAMIEDAGFAIDHLQAGYMPGPKAFTFMSEGAARPR